MESAPRRVARNATVRMAGEVVAKLGSLAFFVTMARRLGTHGFGEFQFALALTGALAFVAGFGTDNLIAREVARDHGRAGRLLADAAAVKVLGGALMLGVAALIVNLGDYTAEGRAAVYVVGVGSLCEVIVKSWHAVFQGHERLELVSATLIVQRLVTAAVGIAVLLSGGGAVAAAAVYAGGALLSLLVAEGLLRRLGVRRGSLAASRWLPLMRAGVPGRVIFTDHAGFNTYATMARAKRIFEVSSAIVVTQGFHIDRALYLAKSAGIGDVQGLTSDIHPYGQKQKESDIRELLARPKALFDTVTDAGVMGGPQIPITGDGRASWGSKPPPGTPPAGAPSH